jgi:phage replication-related protein YjqB (UPF0714/DUF867 family)
MDKYESYEELRRNEQEDHFRIDLQVGLSGVAVMAPHGGGIEPGTTEIAKGVAGSEHTFYAFEGLKQSGNRDLHIMSTNFDEPIGIETARKAQRVVTIHGCAKKEEVVHVGGLDNDLKNKIAAYLSAAGFRVQEYPDSALQGESPNNICNQGKNRRGVQIEVSSGLRQIMFESLSKKGRTRTKPSYKKFISTLRLAIT